MIKGNRWQLRTTLKEGDCFVCHKMSNSCLVHMDSQPPVDWFYTCLTHLNESGFAILLNPQPAMSGKGTKDSKKEKLEKEKEEKDDKKEKEIKEEKENDDKEKEKEKEKKPEAKEENRYKEYALHRDIFFLRERNLLQKHQAKRDAELMKQFPKVPKNLP